MNELLVIGFERAGHWVLENDKLKHELMRHSSQKNVLYAFICDGEVKYIGKTVRTLAARMAGYRTPGKTQTTNINNHRRIRDQLAAGAAVEIFVLPDNGLMHYGKFHLNLAAGLEDDLIRVINPDWNGGISEGTVIASSPATIDSKSEHQPELEPVTEPIGGFSFKLWPTYYRSGFFNVGVGAQNLLGADGEMIELFLGDRENPVLGTINRRANSNATPRVMGGTELRNWFREYASVDANISVEVLSPTSIRLNLS